MSTGWENVKPAPLEFLHSKLMELFHEYRKQMSDGLSVEMSGTEINNLIAKAKLATYAEYPNQQRTIHKNAPKIVCLCGSTRFAVDFMIHRWCLEKQGIMTLGINILPSGYFKDGDSNGAEQEGVKHILDELHMRKIDISDEVFVINKGGYIGESTRAEIEYAKKKRIPVRYLEPI